MRRRRALQVAGSLLVGGLSGCTSTNQVFSTYRYEKDSPVDGPVAVPWRTMGYDARRSGYTRYGRLPSTTTVTPLADMGRSLGSQAVYVEGTAYFSYDRREQLGVAGLVADGQPNESWMFRETDRVAPPTVVGDAIFVTSDGVTRALDRRDGTLCWEYHDGNGHRTASPTVEKDTVYATGDRVFALDARTGAVRWASDRTRLDLRGTAIMDDGIFATAGDGSRGIVYRFDRETGRTQWTTSITDDLPVSPVLADLVYVVEAGGRIRALDPADGSDVWSHELDSRSQMPPAVADGTVYAVGKRGNRLLALDAATGDTRWEFIFDAQRAVGPTVAGDTVFLPTSGRNGGFVHELDAKTSAYRRRHDIPLEPAAPVAIGVDVALVTTVAPSGSSVLYSLS